MNAMRPGLPDPLLQLLGAGWAMGAPVTGVGWLGDQGVAGFGLADGTVALARAAWDGAPSLRPRDGGGVELVPAEGPPPPVMRFGVHAGPCLAVAGDSSGMLVSGGADGRFAGIGADGEVVTLADFAGAPVGLLATGPVALACAIGSTVFRIGGAGGSLEAPGPVGALAFDFTGRRLAIAHEGGATVWSDDGASLKMLPGEGSHGALAWSPDGTLLVSGLAAGGHGWRLQGGEDFALGGYDGAPRSLAFSAPGGFLATSGGARVVGWRFDGAAPAREEFGVSSTVKVVRVACHPVRPVIAAGYENGAILLCQPGGADILFVRSAGGGSVSALAWSDDGGFLALGVEGGDIGVVAFPELLFRSDVAAAQRDPAS